MKLGRFLTMKSVATVGWLCAWTLAAVACTDGQGSPTSPTASTTMSGLAVTAPWGIVPSVPAASRRNGPLHVTKECSAYTGAAGSFCTITSSNLDAIKVGSRVVYASAAGPGSLDSNVVLDLPGPGNNRAAGHCALAFATGLGLCTFSGGTGTFTFFHATANVSYLGGPDWAWDGTYTFSPRD